MYQCTPLGGCERLFRRLPHQRLDDRRTTMSGCIQVVVGEGDAAVRQHMVQTLERSGYAVREATDGLQLVDQIVESLTQRGCEDNMVIVSAVELSGLSGLDVLTALRYAKWRVPMILIGEVSDREDIREAALLGAVVTSRPLRDEALLRLIDEAEPQEAEPQEEMQALGAS